MKLFNCQACGQLLFFENVRCENCGHALGYLPGKGEISALEPSDDGEWKSLADETRNYRLCTNAQFAVCNWLVASDDGGELCIACRHNRTIPDLTVAGNDALWSRVEIAKHRLFYSLLRLELLVVTRDEDPEHGLAFDFLADPPQAHTEHVLTGHDNGIITLALNEADDAVREKVRGEMGEPYRTLLGHFRHESGHYFWDRLVATDETRLAEFRNLFGDERKDYAEALKTHYAQGPPPDWRANFVSAYAAAHPWEDFAETWAHYLHIVDTLETAAAFGLRVKPAQAERAAKIDFDSYDTRDMAQIIDAWLPMTFAVNNLNRSMGLPDLYPFVLSPTVIEKLAFVQSVTHG